uniref:Uncharacterized protein MANES_17G020100 n=1 Tax=Rhizophora mucronata TaxID=61149 RepID=A0A2P2ME16_RHIMU
MEGLIIIAIHAKEEENLQQHRQQLQVVPSQSKQSINCLCNLIISLRN